MKHKMLSRVAVLATACVFSSSGLTDGGSTWNLLGEDSKVSFGSVKLDAVGESHRFTKLWGRVNDRGRATIRIELASVNTGIEIRDTRMRRYVFEGMMPAALLIANIDPMVLASLAPAATTTIDVAGTLSLGDRDIDINTSMFLAKLSEKKVMATTDEMVLVSTEVLGITRGVDKLMELASLPSIGRVVPVTLRFVFEKGEPASD